MIEATAAGVRRLMRRGFDTADIARMFNGAGIDAQDPSRVWREADVWNLLAREPPPVQEKPALRETWAYGLREMVRG